MVGDPEEVRLRSLNDLCRRLRLPGSEDLGVGEVVTLSQQEGRSMQVKVASVTDATVTLDANHPLAGETLIFDLEIAFLFPWAVSLDTVGKFGLLAMGLFLAILVVGFIYEWKKGALEWE